MKRKAVIFGIKGLKLTKGEEILISKHKPWGIILFSRNINNIEQVKKLIKNIKKKIRDKNYPILIDQEGGSISRLNRIFDFSCFSQKNFSKLYLKNKKKFYVYYSIYISSLSSLLRDMGININTVPILDVLTKNTNKVIDDRSYSNDPMMVKKLGAKCIDLFSGNKIATIIKHIPGHGVAHDDSHFKTPVTTASRKHLITKHFKPFIKSKAFFAMTAHVVYKSYDPDYTATHSKIVITDVIRNHIGFKGILISDDISMKALRYSVLKNATKAIDSGCNIVLHCNASIREMNKLVKIIPNIDNFTTKKTLQFYNFLR